MKKANLFSENDNQFHLEDEDDSYAKSLNHKVDLSSKKTKKLIELESKLAHDPRFKIDERFVDEDNEKESENDINNEDGDEIQQEKTRNCTTLKSVIEKPLRSNKSSKPFLLTPRFDPTKEECKVYEIKPNCKRKHLPAIDLEEIGRKIQKKATNIPIANNNDNNQNNALYYEKIDNLKDLFSSETKDFTIGLLLGEDENITQVKESKKQILEEGQYVPGKRFRYDSSDSDPDQKLEKNVDIKIDSWSSSSTANSSSWSGFFFYPNDPRLDPNNMKDEDCFFRKDLMNSNFNQRKMDMIKALSLRKKAALKNKRSEERYSLKQKIKKRFVIQKCKMNKKNASRKYTKKSRKPMKTES